MTHEQLILDETDNQLRCPCGNDCWCMDFSGCDARGILVDDKETAFALCNSCGRFFSTETLDLIGRVDPAEVGA